MSACAMLTFNNISTDTWRCIQEAASQYGITGSDSGQQTVNGFTVAWSFVAATQTLQIQCLDSPFFVGCSTINSHIHDAVENCLSNHQLELGPMMNT
jgi:hypothetical protein